jgi:transposase
VCKTWAPVGQTPCLRHYYRRERLSTISAITVSPRSQRLGLYVAFHAKNISGVEVVAFVGQLLRHLRGSVVLLWDGVPMHRRRLVQEFLRQHPRLHVYRFPGYAPELNPDEWVWQQAKHALSNGAPKNLQELGRRLRRSLRRIQRSQRRLWSCIWASELPWQR